MNLRINRCFGRSNSRYFSGKGSHIVVTIATTLSHTAYSTAWLRVLYISNLLSPPRKPGRNCSTHCVNHDFHPPICRTFILTDSSTPPAPSGIWMHTKAPGFSSPITEINKGFDGVDLTYKEEGGHESGCEIVYPQEGVAPIVTPWWTKPCSCY